MNPELTASVLSLPLEERQSLLDLLRQSIGEEFRDRERKATEQGVARLLELAAYAVGQNSVTPGRGRRNAFARTMVAYELILDGLRVTQIGRLLGKDHSTIIHMRNQMTDVFAYPSVYKDEMKMWNNFQALVKNEID